MKPHRSNVKDYILVVILLKMFKLSNKKGSGFVYCTQANNNVSSHDIYYLQCKTRHILIQCNINLAMLLSSLAVVQFGFQSHCTRTLKHLRILYVLYSISAG